MGLNDLKLEETQESGVAFPFVKSSIHSVFLSIVSGQMILVLLQDQVITFVHHKAF